MGTILTYLLPLALLLLLISAGVEDVRQREIANWKNAAIAVLAPLWWLAIGMTPWPDMAWQLAGASAVFALFVVVFAFGAMGGGDVKMIGALALWAPFDSVVVMLVAMSLIGGVITAAMMIERKVRRDPAQIQVPYGIAIACAAILTFHEPIFNQFR